MTDTYQDDTAPDPADDLLDDGQDPDGPDDDTPDPIDDDGEDDPDAPPKPSKDVEKLERRMADKERAFKAERRKRQDGDAQRQALEARLAALEAPKANGYDPLKELAGIPDTDPIGQIDALKKIVANFAQQDSQTRAQAERQTQQQANIQALASWAGDREAEFTADNADYPEAATHFAKSRVTELELTHGKGRAAQAAFEQELVGIMARCREQGRDPAEVVYGLARNRGFGVDAGAKRLQTVDRGQQASRSLSSTGGKQGDGGLSTEALMKAQGPEFDKLWAQYEKQAKKAQAR